MWAEIHFQTRNETCITATNGTEDDLLPARVKVGLPGISYLWLRRGRATMQQHNALAEKPIQGQLKHSKVETTRDIYVQQVAPETFEAVLNLEQLVETKREALSHAQTGQNKELGAFWCMREAEFSLGEKFGAEQVHWSPTLQQSCISAHRNSLKPKVCGSNSVVESQPSKLLVAGSIPVSRSMFSTI